MELFSLGVVLVVVVGVYWQWDRWHKLLRAFVGLIGVVVNEKGFVIAEMDTQLHSNDAAKSYFDCLVQIKTSEWRQSSLSSPASADTLINVPIRPPRHTSQHNSSHFCVVRIQLIGYLFIIVCVRVRRGWCEELAHTNFVRKQKSMEWMVRTQIEQPKTQ